MQTEHRIYSKSNHRFQYKTATFSDQRAVGCWRNKKRYHDETRKKILQFVVQKNFYISPTFILNFEFEKTTFKISSRAFTMCDYKLVYKI